MQRKEGNKSDEHLLRTEDGFRFSNPFLRVKSDGTGEGNLDGD